MSSTSGLSRAHRHNARRLVTQAQALTLAHRDAIHYTQDARRWQGIDRNLRAWRGEYPHYADCSSIATWILWQGLGHYHVRDTVNGEDWRAGWTGTMLDHGKTVHLRRSWDIGDLFIYDGHVATYMGGGMVHSHGSEGGPYKLEWNYRNDLIVVKRSI